MNNVIKSNPIEDELDAIRVELYEQTKEMTVEERIAYLRQLATPIHREFGITPIQRKTSATKGAMTSR